MASSKYGTVSYIQFNERQTTSIEIKSWLSLDVALIERLLGVGLLSLWPRLWMLGEIEPLKGL